MISDAFLYLESKLWLPYVKKFFSNKGLKFLICLFFFWAFYNSNEKFIIQERIIIFKLQFYNSVWKFMFLPCNTWSSQVEVFAAEIYNSVWKHVVRSWYGPDAKAFAGIYKSNWVCSVDALQSVIYCTWKGKRYGSERQDSLVSYNGILFARWRRATGQMWTKLCMRPGRSTLPLPTMWLVWYQQRLCSWDLAEWVDEI